MYDPLTVDKIYVAWKAMVNRNINFDRWQDLCNSESRSVTEMQTLTTDRIYVARNATVNKNINSDSCENV